MRFTGKKVLVTGASRGIGHAIAQAFRTEDAWVIGTRTSKANATDDVCQEWIVADFADMAQIKVCAEHVRSIGPDILVNNAGINKIAPFTEIAADDFLRIQQVNVAAPFLLCQAAIPAMRNKKWGRIVNVSSIWGKISRAQRASYSASKFAIDGITLALALEHGLDGILANSIAPGFVDTDLTRSVLGEAGMQALISKIPLGRLGKAEDIAQFVLWLASEENSYMTGQNIAIDGGFSRA